MFTIKDLGPYTFSKDDYDYQPSLTTKLDSSSGDLFTQELVNEIVLWKLNRYVKINDNTFVLLNSEKLKGETMDEAFTSELLTQLLGTRGIRLPMASTILRFRNPSIFQIIDQRAYRFVYGEELKLAEPKNEKLIGDQIHLYFEYLDKLKAIAKQRGWDYAELDRILYALDIKHNKKITIRS